MYAPYTVKELKEALRNGVRADGGYPTYFYSRGGEVLSHEGVRENFRTIIEAMTSTNDRSGWAVDGQAINYEDSELYCSSTNKRIPSAYAEDQANDTQAVSAEDEEEQDSRKNAELLIDSHNGIYIGQFFAQQFGQFIPDGENKTSLLNGPDDEWYLDAWDTILNNTVMEIDGKTYTLDHDEDLWAIPA